VALPRRVWLAVLIVGTILAIGLAFHVRRVNRDVFATFVDACGAQCGPSSVRFGGGFLPGPAAPLLPSAARVIAGQLATESATSAGALGVVRILGGAEDAGMATLEEAMLRQPQDPRVLNDLSAAVIARALRLDMVHDLVRGLSLARRAADLSAKPEPLFNAAVALEGLGLRRRAAETWDQYLAIDAVSPWTPIAHARRSALSDGPRTPAATRISAVEQVILNSWPTSVPDPKAMDRERRRAIDMARSSSDDAMPLDAATALSTSPTANAAALAKGLAAFGHARTLYDDDQPTAAAPEFETARRLLEETKHPYAGWAHLYLSIVAYLNGALDDADAILDRVIRNAQPRRYVSLGGRAHYMKGLVAQTRADPIRALPEYDAAVQAARTTHDADNEAAALSQMAGVRDMLGDRPAAWRARRSALGMLPGVTSPRRRHVVLLSSARAALADAAPEAARDFALAALENATAWQRAGALTEAHVQLARVGLALHQPADAAASISEAQRALARVSDARFARRFELELLAAAAEARSQSAASGVTEATDAITRLREARGALLIPSVLHTRARARIKQGDRAGAEQDLVEALSAFEQQRSSVPVVQGRVTSFPEYRDTLSDLIALQADAGRPEDAWQTAERGRARALLTVGEAPTPIRLAEVQQRIDADSAMLYYAVMDERVFTWVITKQSFTQQTLDVSASALASEAEAYRRSLESYNAESARVLGGRVFERIVAPVQASLAQRRELIIVADDILAGIPFASLRDARSGRYLAETYQLRLAPSATLALEHGTHGPDRVLRTALVIAPAASGERLLRDSIAEAEAIASRYDSSRLLAGAHATKVEVMHQMGEYDVVHFAGHAETSLDFPNLSRLIVRAPGGDREDAIYAYELQPLRMTRTQLVVLAGCRTGIGRALRGEGALSLARSFVGAGVPAVVATLWDIRDRPARTFFERFHALLPGRSVAAALQATQREMMASNDPELQSPGTWSGVYVITTGGQ
jgi:CHAT domain-containing protein